MLCADYAMSKLLKLFVCMILNGKKVAQLVVVSMGRDCYTLCSLSLLHYNTEGGGKTLNKNNLKMSKIGMEKKGL